MEDLDYFTGTTNYHQLYHGIILTDGALYLAEKGGCFWLMDLYASYLWLLDGNVEPFTVLRLTRKNDSADVVIDDGNGNTLYTQHIEYTDFPLAEIKLYASWTVEFWVLMLPSEY